MSRVIVERKLAEQADFDELQAQEDAVAWCLEQYRIKFVRSYFSKDRSRMICEYDAPDAEAVRTVQQTSGLPYERIWTARVFDWSK